MPLQSSNRNMVILFVDLLMAAASLPVALFLRWGRDFTIYSAGYLDWGMAICAFFALLSFMYFHTHIRLWRYVSLSDVVAFTKAVTLALFCFYVVLFLINRLELMPRSVPPIHWLVLLAMLCGPRLLVRMHRDNTPILRAPKRKNIPVLLLGTGDEAEMFIRESQRNASFSYEVIGLLSSQTETIGRRLHDVHVFGVLEDVEIVLQLLQKKNKMPQRLIIAEAHPDGAWVQKMLTLSQKYAVPLARLPSLTDFRTGEQPAFQVRPVAVEDVLGRPQIPLDMEAMRALLCGKRVLVTGAGGSIGSELVRQIAALDPAHIDLFELSEYALYTIDHEIRSNFADISCQAILGDVRDRDVIARVFAQANPDIVFHAAALKHVPLAESNVVQTVLTNVLGTQYVVDACCTHNVANMVLISTDKAVNPTNVMGTTKRLAEAYCQSIVDNNDTNTNIITVRFGNVLGSTGSVVPLFQQQLEKGGPLTITHPEITRYFMTIREAVALVIQAAALRYEDTTQKAPIYVLDMGTPIKIIDLAKQMIQLAGLRIDQDIAIEYTGLRPGEKLHEELFHAHENLSNTPHPSIQLAMSRRVEHAELVKGLTTLYDAARAGDVELCRQLLHALVPEFTAAA